jgi:beta-lactam-binding protein with PASTA domain
MNPAAKILPDLTGKTKEESLIILSQSGFQFQIKTQGGYESFAHEDGSVIHIRPNGEIVRTGPKIRNFGNKPYRHRYDQYGNKIQFIPGENTHQTGEQLR